MSVFELVVPGTWLDYEDRDWAWEVGGLLDNLQSHFFDANLALDLFARSQQSRVARSMSRDMWKRDIQLRREIRIVIEQEREQQGLSTSEDWEELHHQTEVRFKHEKWKGGVMPREFEHRIPFMYAQAFLYALDGFDKFLGVLAKTEGVPKEIGTFHLKMADLFPDLRGVRNSTQHLEDRFRYLGAYGKPLVLQPIDNQMVKAPAGALILNSLNGSKYGSTMADGHYGEVDVSPESMTALQGLLNDVLRLFCWRGPRQHRPNV